VDTLPLSPAQQLLYSPSREPLLSGATGRCKPSIEEGARGP